MYITFTTLDLPQLNASDIVHSTPGAAFDTTVSLRHYHVGSRLIRLARQRPSKFRVIILFLLYTILILSTI